jgi:hypothetical protein
MGSVSLILSMQKQSKRKRTPSFCLAALLVFFGVACKGKHTPVAVQNEEPDQAPRLVSSVRMNDTAAAAQLLNGFYPVESGAWRWTAGKFSVLLRTPPGSAQSGATLDFAFTIPEVVIQKLNNLKLTASINGMDLKSDEYKQPGPQTFNADVPGSMLTPDSIKVDFALDKSLPPGLDKRELGVIATSAGLAPK